MLILTFSFVIPVQAKEGRCTHPRYNYRERPIQQSGYVRMAGVKPYPHNEFSNKMSAGGNYNTRAGRNYNTGAGRNYNTGAGLNYKGITGRNYNTGAGFNYRVSTIPNYCRTATGFRYR